MIVCDTIHVFDRTKFSTPHIADTIRGLLEILVGRT